MNTGLISIDSHSVAITSKYKHCEYKTIMIKNKVCSQYEQQKRNCSETNVFKVEVEGAWRALDFLTT